MCARFQGCKADELEKCHLTFCGVIFFLLGCGDLTVKWEEVGNLCVVRGVRVSCFAMVKWEIFG